MNNHRPVTLVILDGWGVAPPSRGNAITLAKTPVWQKLLATYPSFTVQSSGESVGLPWGEIGNSEVGHLTIGSGKILYQDLPRITRAIIDKSFFQNEALVNICRTVRERQAALHIIGLVSPGGVHSVDEHLYALLELAKQEKLERVFIHAILDGRDTPLDSGLKCIQLLERKCKKIGIGIVATIMGRFYAMDRDNHWDRIQAAYECMVHGKGQQSLSATEAIAASYASKVYDEELVPTVVMSANEPVCTISPNDGIIHFNFRPDRARQLTYALALPEFDKFSRGDSKGFSVVTMTEYEKGLPVTVAFPPEIVEYPLARLISDAGLKQLHLAETEKYAHVTYFFNGGREQPYPAEDHVLIPSPVVSSYDQKPAMSARGITDRFLTEVRRGNYDVYIINYANADMVAHTGNLPATVQAVEILDACLGEVVAATLESGGAICITADHGNAEGLINMKTGIIDKEHSATPVPFIVVAREYENKGDGNSNRDLSQLIPAGVLADVAPTVLQLLNIAKPIEMTGRSLL